MARPWSLGGRLRGQAAGAWAIYWHRSATAHVAERRPWHSVPLVRLGGSNGTEVSSHEPALPSGCWDEGLFPGQRDLHHDPWREGATGIPCLPLLTNSSPLQADVLLLCSSEPHSLTYIETTELDG